MAELLQTVQPTSGLPLTPSWFPFQGKRRRITLAQTAHLTAAEAKNHVGETATVCGRVVRIYFAHKAKGLPTLMNIDMPYPHQILTIVIWETDRKNFGNLKRTYRDKNICVSGKITIHHEIPEIVINTPGQIRIQK